MIESTIRPKLDWDHYSAYPVTSLIDKYEQFIIVQNITKEIRYLKVLITNIKFLQNKKLY